MVIGYLLWFYFADLLLFWGGWVGEIEDKVHLSPAEAEIGAELGKNKTFAWNRPGLNLRYNQSIIPVNPIPESYLLN